MHALFIAGGSGTRLWPLSREENPKQLQSLIGSKSLMTQTIERVEPLVEAQNIWIVTNQKYFDQVAAHSPDVLRAQIITEPFALGTNLAVGLGLFHLIRENPDAIVLIGWADSHIGKEAEFCEALRRASEIARNSQGVILGVKPNFASTAYGYLEIGNRFDEKNEAFEIAKFEEKPSAERAAEFCQSGRHFWNSGISVWKASSLIGLMERHTPAHFAALKSVAATIGTEKFFPKMIEAFTSLPKTAIDTSIFEKAEGLVTLPIDVEWNDIGAWSAIYDVQTSDSEHNITRGQVVSLDTEKCLIYADKRLIATLGVSDLVIIETEDAILVARKDDTSRLKELHAKIKATGATCL